MKSPHAHKPKRRAPTRRTVALGLLCLLAAAAGPWGAGWCSAQTTHNIDIIWQMQSPDSRGSISYWGFNIVSGDLNGDGFSDFVSYTDSNLGVSAGLKCYFYIFKGGDTISTTPYQVLIYNMIGTHPKLCIADFNGDGYCDLAIGDAYGTGINETKGCVNLHYGSSGYLDNTPDIVIQGNGGSFGWSLSSGDINGDGLDDLIVGAQSYTINGNRNGRVYVYYGDTIGVHTTPSIILNGHFVAGYAEHFGMCVDGSVDFNKDGYNDLLVGAYLNCTREIAAGKVYYFISNNTPIDTIPDGWVYGEGYEHWLGGNNVSGINADTITIEPTSWYGTPIWGNNFGLFGAGKCYMTLGTGMGEITPEWAVIGEDTALGYWTSTAGDVDDDGLEDILAGAAPAFNGRGKAYLWLRRPTMRQECDAYMIGRYTSTSGLGDVLGARVAPAGDVDGDGKDEFLVSNYFADSSNMIWLCKYTGPNAVEGVPAASVERPAYRLKQNYPNPFKQTTKFDFQLAKAGPMSLKIYNIAGQLVRTMVEGEQLAGRHHCQWDGSDDQGKRVAAGQYVYKFKAGGREYRKKMILLK